MEGIDMRLSTHIPFHVGWVVDLKAVIIIVVCYDPTPFYKTTIPTAEPGDSSKTPLKTT